LVNQLREIGIIPVIRNESESGRLAVFGSPCREIRRYCHIDELEKARGIVQKVIGIKEAAIRLTLNNSKRTIDINNT